MGKIHKKSPQIVNHHSDHRLIRRSLFNTAGSFGVALRSVALRFQGFGGMSQDNSLHPIKGPCAFSALKGCVALQVAFWKVLQYRGGVADTLSPVALQ